MGMKSGVEHLSVWALVMLHTCYFDSDVIAIGARFTGTDLAAKYIPKTI